MSVSRFRSRGLLPPIRWHRSEDIHHDEPSVRRRPGRRVFRSALLVPVPSAVAGDEPSRRGLPARAQMAESLQDVWGEAATELPGGPSFQAFRDLLPPLRYTNTQFRDYPIVLSAPWRAAKARWISNGRRGESPGPTSRRCGRRPAGP